MLDEIDTHGGKLKAEGLGEYDVEWRDGQLTIDVATWPEVERMLRYIKVGPKMEATLLKLKDAREARSAQNRQPVQKPQNPEPTQAAAGVIEDVKTEPEPEPAEPPALTVEGKPGLNRDAALAAYAAKEAEEKAAKAAEEQAAAEKAAEDKPAKKRAKKKTSKAKPKPNAAEDEGMSAVLSMFDMANPTAKGELPQLTDEQKEKLEESARKVNEAAENFEAVSGWQVPLEGEEYDGEGVNHVESHDEHVVLTLASGVKVAVDYEGTEIDRQEPQGIDSLDPDEAHGAEPEDEGMLPQELATTPKLTPLVLHFNGRGMGKDEIISALEELKKQGHPAVANVDDVEARVGVML